MTRKLYDENAYLRTFSANVLSCEEVKNGWAVVLDATAFFPEGGGQAADTGTLGGAKVMDVQIENGVITHFCASALPVGEPVEGEIDWPQRYDRMQQHSGEHIISGIVHRMTGYSNTGFHMGQDGTTVDFSGKLTDEQLTEIQANANRVVTENRAFTAWYPEKKELKSLEYRSKKEILEAVRMVEIDGIDRCACCAPHVHSAAETGPIVILGRESFHGGTRIHMLCGEKATAYLTRILEQNKGVSALLSAKPLETFAAVKRMADELGSVKFQINQAARELYSALAEVYRGKGSTVLFRESGDAGKLACAVSETCGGVCAVFVETENGFRYAISGENVRELGQKLHAQLGGKGGGKPDLVQGSVPAQRAEIEAFFGRQV